jgi:hypothetical protein
MIWIVSAVVGVWVTPTVWVDTTQPATCRIGQLAVDTDGAQGARLYLCRAVNTWQAVDESGAAGGSLTVEEADVAPTVANVTKIQFDQADGFTVTDETGGQIQVDLAAIPDSVLAASYSGTGACGANTFASTLNDAAAPTCTQPSFSNLSGAATDGQVPNNITIDAAAALTADPGDCSGNNFAIGIVAAGTATCAQPAFSNLSGSATIAQGGTTETASVEDAVLVGSGTTDWQSKVIPNCPESGTLNYDSTTNTFSCLTDSGGGGNSVEVSVDLGPSGGLAFAKTQTGQAWVTSGSHIVCTPFATTADGQTVETYRAAALVPAVGNLVAATGFDLFVDSPRGATGIFRFRCLGT